MGRRPYRGRGTYPVLLAGAATARTGWQAVAGRNMRQRPAQLARLLYFAEAWIHRIVQRRWWNGGLEQTELRRRENIGPHNPPDCVLFIGEGDIALNRVREKQAEQALSACSAQRNLSFLTRPAAPQAWRLQSVAGCRA